MYIYRFLYGRSGRYCWTDVIMGAHIAKRRRVGENKGRKESRHENQQTDWLGGTHKKRFRLIELHRA